MFGAFRRIFSAGRMSQRPLQRIGVHARRLRLRSTLQGVSKGEPDAHLQRRRTLLLQHRRRHVLQVRLPGEALRRVRCADAPLHAHVDLGRRQSDRRPRTAAMQTIRIGRDEAENVAVFRDVFRGSSRHPRPRSVRPATATTTATTVEGLKVEDGRKTEKQPETRRHL